MPKKKLEVLCDCPVEPHPCLFAQDMSNGEVDDEDNCTCCEKCQEQCCLDI